MKTKKTKKSTAKEKVKVHYRGLESLTYRGLKRKAVSMGMPFPDACAADAPKLASYIYNNPVAEKDELITLYDQWMDQQLEIAGYASDDPMRHYQLRLGFIAEDAMEDIPVMGSKPKKPKVEKPKRVKDEIGLWKGTKKSYTFELAQKGLTLERTTKRVMKKFPDANENSIKQWHKKALRDKK